MNELLLEKDERHHIKFLPFKTADILPEDEGDGIRFCERKFKELEESKEAKCLFVRKSKSKGFLISVWELNENYYLIQDVRNEFGSYNDCIYISKEKDDMLGIANFLHKNINTIMKDYKKQIEDGKKYVQRERLN